MTTPNPNDWWRNAVIYQIYPRSFADSNGDGDGDLNGVTSRLDYLASLNVDALWLSPFYPSPQADGGYDVADYCAVDPHFGTMEDFDRLVAQAHARGIRIIIDIVPNHTSNQHPWFQEALAAEPDSAARDRYVFRRGKGKNGEIPPTNWLSNFGGSAWEPCGDGWYYLHLFAREQPDLNWNNPDVRGEFLRMLKFWCDKGVDGFRIDVSHGLAKDLRDPLRDRPDPTVKGPQADDGSDPLWDRDEVHTIYRSWRELFDQYMPAKYAIGESWQPFSPRIFQYARQDELGAVFDFSLEKASWGRDIYRTVIERTCDYAQKAATAPTWVLGNHDVPRIASRIGLPAGANIDRWVTSDGTDPAVDPMASLRRARAAALVMLGLPGTAFIYQGEELGLPEDFDLTIEQIQDPNWERSGHLFKGRDGCRVPLPWAANGSAFGFNDTGASWLPQPSWYAGYAVDSQCRVPESTLSLYRTALALRPQWVAGSGDITMTWLDDPATAERELLAWRLPSGLVVAVNFSADSPASLPEHTQVLVCSDPRWREGDDMDSLPAETAVWLAS